MIIEPKEIPETVTREINVLKFFEEHNGRIGKDGRVYLYVVCDGTYSFMFNMYYVLKQIGCTDIQADVETVTGSEIKPWCTTKFMVSGILPKEFFDDN